HDISIYTYSENRLVSRTLSKRITYYNENGTIKKQERKWYCYDGSGNLLHHYAIKSYFDNKGKLTSKTAIINVSQEEELGKYIVTYEINDEGGITYTHVYDEDGNKIEELSGRGEIHPAEIIYMINNVDMVDKDIDDKQKYRDLSREAKERKDGETANAELLQQKTIEEKIEKQARDPLFCGQMAEKENLLQKNKN
ncbi:unnamed protein product, partial [marine sediment metagenome]